MQFRALLVPVLALALAGPAQAFRHLEPGQRLSPVDLRGTAGETHHLAADSGQATLVLFWATWSPRSLQAMADFEELHRAHAAEGLQVVAVNVEGENLKPADEARVAEAAGRSGVTYGVALDRGLDLYASWGVGAVPSAVLVDRDGKVMELLPGYPPGAGGKLRGLVEAALEGSQAAATAAGTTLALRSEHPEPSR